MPSLRDNHKLYLYKRCIKILFYIYIQSWKKMRLTSCLSVGQGLGQTWALGLDSEIVFVDIIYKYDIIYIYMYTGKLFLIFLRYSVTRLNKYFMFSPLFFLNNPPINGVCWVDWLTVGCLTSSGRNISFIFRLSRS